MTDETRETSTAAETSGPAGIWSRGGIKPSKAAKKYAVSRTALYGLMSRGLPFAKVGRARVIAVAPLEAWLEANTVGVSTAK